MNKKPVTLSNVTFGDRDRTLSKNERATNYGYFKEEANSGAGSIRASVWHTGRVYVESTHRRKMRFQNSSGFRVVERERGRFKKLDEEILDLLLRADMQEDELDKEMQGADEYVDKYKRLNLVVQKSLDTTSKMEKCDNSLLNVKKRKFKLPTIELKKFDGDVKDWLTFWGQFKKIDGDPDIDEADKFQYLLRATSPDTRAREVVESFPLLASTYNKAVECLKARFGRENLLVEFYVKALLKLTVAMKSKEDKVTLSSLYNRIDTPLRVLETLGLATEKYAAMLFPLV